MDRFLLQSATPAFSVVIRSQSDVRLAVIGCQHKDLLPVFPVEERGIVGTVVSELATNIVKYAHAGQVCLYLIEEASRHGVVIEATDDGPGICDLQQALSDGYSTGGTLGLGLPAVKRMTDELDISALPAGGTRVRALRWCRYPITIRQDHVLTQPPTDVGSAKHDPVDNIRPFKFTSQVCSRAFGGADVSGDRSALMSNRNLLLLIQLDCTGHGHLADRAAREIIETLEKEFMSWEDPDPCQGLLHLLEACHARAQSGVGGALSIGILDLLKNNLSHVGIGNTSMMLFKPNGWEGISQPGILGHRYRSPKLTSTPIHHGDSIVAFSDGISLSGMRALRRRSDRPSSSNLIAEAIMALAKDSDDSSCLVVSCLTE